MKAHIARNQNAGVPLALGWNLSAGDRGKLDGMATEQGYYALAAYYRFMNKQSSLYDMRDVTVKLEPAKPTTPTTGDSGVTVWFLALSVSALAAAFVLTRKKRKAE